MLLFVHRLTLQKWRPLFLRLLNFCIRFIFNRGTPETAHDLESAHHESAPIIIVHLSAHYPLTSNEIRTKIDEFIKLIDEDGVTRLTSQYNHSKQCNIFRRENGSFNVCFFVHFPEDGVRWVLRVPIVPVIQDYQLKVQSEVDTMLYVDLVPMHSFKLINVTQICGK